MSRAVIIGSGPNGLAAAIRLAEAGLEVIVLEAAGEPGGAVRTEELTLPGFRHDSYSAVYPAAAASPVFARMPLAEHGLEWVHPEACMAHPLEDGTAIGLYRDLERTVESLERQAAGDGRRWERFVKPYLRGFDAVRSTMLAPFPPVRGALQLPLAAGPRAAAAFPLLLNGQATALARRLFRSPGARAWLYGAAMHGDATPSAPGSAIAGFYLNLMGHAVGWPSPRGGAAGLSDALLGHLRSLGGELRTQAGVERIASRGGRVRGVRLAGGEELSASTVIAVVMPHALLEMAGPALSGWYRAMVGRYLYGPATVKVDWALSGPIPWRAAAARQAGTVHVGGAEPAMLASIEIAQCGIPARPFMLIGQQSVADRARAPEGKHTAWAYTHAPAALADQLGAPATVEAMEAQVERFAPGFHALIMQRHVLTPADLERRDANLVHGDVGGGSYRLRQAVFRPLPALSPYRTPLAGLFLGSAATFPGGGVHGVPGDAAARAALRASRRSRGRQI